MFVVSTEELLLDYAVVCQSSGAGWGGGERAGITLPKTPNHNKAFLIRKWIEMNGMERRANMQQVAGEKNETS